MSKTKIFLTIGLLLIGAGIILLFLSSSRQEDPSPPTQAQGVSLYGYDEEGALSWGIEAREGKMKDDKGSLFEVEVIFYTDGKERLQARADTLTFEKREVTLSGNVEVIRHDGYHLQTEAITWVEAVGELTATRVRITSTAASLEAGQFRYDLKSEHSFLEEGVTATLDRSPPLHIVGDKAEEKDGRLILTGGVVVQGDEETYHCARITYDPGTEETQLSGEVNGTLPSGTIRAELVTLSSDGLSAGGGVHLFLNHRFFEGTDSA